MRSALRERSFTSRGARPAASAVDPEKSWFRLRGLSREAIVADQRRRLLEGVADSVSERGLQRSSVEHVIQAAGVSRKTFYEIFPNKEEAYRAAHAEALKLLGGRVEAACGREAEWPDKVAAGTGAALRWAATDPRRAALLATFRRTESAADPLLARFGPSLRRGRALAPIEPPPNLEEALIGGLAWVVETHLSPTDATSLPDLAPQLTHFVLAPYVGADRARRVSIDHAATASGD